ncbi:hypothetical protein AA106555_2044 [Neokomagataea thailandica NBRC 106555]|uniref:DUF4760 domain-containing protein n=2 Tax=Neokomagataea TaxID=1223423 RepID=A0A4Y6V893_9PROT|nr:MULTISPECIES: hypothetical protein [Neokomagataea]QDH25564.1 hypothetical protein D5366_10440 [Neokomagataea tanensis]GBR55546.1 hypothetical protein AA106555_2044 [Neokomagataea thailandica NBRC 106555]
MPSWIEKNLGKILLGCFILSLFPFGWIACEDYKLNEAGTFGDFSNWFQALVAIWTLLAVIYTATKAYSVSENSNKLIENSNQIAENSNSISEQSHQLSLEAIYIQKLAIHAEIISSIGNKITEEKEYFDKRLDSIKIENLCSQKKDEIIGLIVILTTRLLSIKGIINDIEPHLHWQYRNLILAHFPGWLLIEIKNKYILSEYKEVIGSDYYESFSQLFDDVRIFINPP